MLLAQRRASLRQEPERSIPDTPMEIAGEIARLVLEKRDGGHNNVKVKGKRLELLAERFLRITEQADSILGVGPPHSNSR